MTVPIHRLTRIGAAFVLGAGALVVTATGAPAVSGPATATPAAGTLVDDVVAWFQAADPTLIVDPVCVDPSGVSPVVYSPNRVIVRTTNVVTVRKQVNTILKAIEGPGPGNDWVLETETLTLPTPPSGPAIVPVVRVELKPHDGEPHPLLRLARSLNDLGTKASLDYGLVPSPFVKFFPAGPPTPAAALDPQRTSLLPGGQPIGTGIRIDIYDTGLATTNQGAFLTDVAALKAVDAENPDANGNKVVDYPHAAHGLAMSGVIKTLTPGASIRIGRIANAKGLATDWTAALRMVRTLKTTPVANWPDIVVHAFGSTGCDRTASQPSSSPEALVPLAMQSFVEAIADFATTKPGGMVLVASAGNRATTIPFYPAAFQLDPALASAVVSVGAIDATVADGNTSAWFTSSRTDPVSDYSNTGNWVEAYAPGDHLATTHAVNLKWDSTGPKLQGLGYVEGTSFAAPYVAALIAERMSRTGGKAESAWSDIARCGRAPQEPLSGPRPIGNGVAVGLVSLTGSATDPPKGSATC